MHKKREKPQKTYYSSTPRKNIPRKRDLENEVTGIYKQGNGNFGFVDTVSPEWDKKWYYVHETKKLDALEWDEVAFTIRVFRGKEEATITKVLKRSEQLIVWKLKLGAKFAFVLAENNTVKQDIFIPWKFIWGYSDGARVAVQVIKWEWKNPEWRIIESLESLPQWREDIYKIAFEMWARKSFPDSVMSFVETLSKTISSEEILKRKDLRNILTYTIDGAESKDLDDAIGVQKIDSGYILYVSIADVTHYTKENSVLDREARKRGTSIYLCDQVIPMLPAELSNGLCSLNPHEDKLTLTCEMHISSKWFVTHSEVYESIISSDYRLTYKEIDECIAGENSIWDDLLFWNILTETLFQNIHTLKSLTDILSKNTSERGALNFDFPETKIILDDTGVPIEYKKYERYNSYKIIEECMVLANESVAKLFAKYPFLYRVHEAPDPEDVDTFVKKLETIINPPSSDHSSVPLNKGEDAAQWSRGIENLSFSELLEVLKANPKLEPFQKLLLRSLQKARYSEKNLWHFGLALKHYSHFTSPIRRYPDLQIHRIIKEIISNKFHQERKEHYQEILPKVSQSSSTLSDRAEKMEYWVRDMMACKYMSGREGEAFTWKISGMIEKWFFIELENTIEGFIEYGLTGYHFDVEKHVVVNNSTQKELHFWDEVQIALKSVDMSRYRLDFEMA